MSVQSRVSPRLSSPSTHSTPGNHVLGRKRIRSHRAFCDPCDSSPLRKTCISAYPTLKHALCFGCHCQQVMTLVDAQHKGEGWQGLAGRYDGRRHRQDLVRTMGDMRQPVAEGLNLDSQGFCSTLPCHRCSTPSLYLPFLRCLKSPARWHQSSSAT